ncbi:MAG: extracellular solute-binding protein [Devosia sp.]|uniref:ABC transporter substrate-binding protein n=1 Tax=Devosia sp. TaxID=1871048 RepID=UPI001A541219|nr:extracellular solute-binding protein [Devosia sp.]MBL8596937.1 extracellular solute-binding protein [Devosia sp.]
MNRLLAAGVSLAVVSLAVPALAQTMPDPANVSGKIVNYVHFTNYIDDGSYDRWEAEFKALYPNVEDIEVLGIADYAGQIATRLATGDIGDVLEISDQVPADELGDFFLPLNDLGIHEDYYFADRWAFDGNVYALTFGVSADGVVYNKEAFKTAGIETVPTKFSELKAAYEKLKASGAYPIVLNLADGWPLTSFEGLATSISGDPNFLNATLEDDTPLAADKPWGKSLGILKDLIDSGLAEDDLSTGHWQDSKGWLASGKGASWFLGNWSISQIATEGATLAGLDNYDANNLGYFPFPYDESGGPYNASSGPDWAMAINTNTANPELAKAWLAFILTKTDLAQKAGFIPGYKKLPPTLPQLAEFQTYSPKLIEGTPPLPALTNVRNTSGWNGGNAIRDLVNAPDFDAAVGDVNAKWAAAAARER